MAKNIFHTVPHRLHSQVIVFGKRPRQTLIFLHGIGNSGVAWHKVIEGLRGSDVRIIVIDLLGFGASPRPKYAMYDSAIQARSVRLTCLLRGVINQKVMIIGHSMGSLVAIEYAIRYPRNVASLLLCSPPLYASPKQKRSLSVDGALRKLYTAIQTSPQGFLRLSRIAMKYDLINAAFNVTDQNIDSYMSALRAAIINQTSLDDIARLTLPIHIIRGTLDPVLVPKHIKRLAKIHDNITLASIVAGHEVKGKFIPHILEAIKAMRQ